MQTSLRVLIALALAMISLPFLSTSASAALIDEIDGIAPSSPTYTDATGGSDDIFIASKEEGDPPTTWGLRWGKADTGGDITAVYTDDEVDVTTGHVWFYFGFARAELGTGAFVVELNQNPNVPVLDSKDPTLSFTVPNRTVGDVRITFDQENGNANLANVGADKWNGTAWSNAPGFDGTTYTSATNVSGLFGEMAVNLTASNLLPVCGSDFTDVNVRSRSSSTETASLKDHVKALRVAIGEERCQSIRVEKLDATTNLPLSGASFQLFADTDNSGTFNSPVDVQVGAGSQPATLGAGTNTYTWNALPWGTYFVKESARPTGYETDPNPTVTNDVQKVTLNGATTNGTAVVTFSNPQTMAQIRVEKYAKTTGNPALSGAGFKLYKDTNGNGTFDGASTDAPVGSEVTASQGTAPDNNTYTWTTPLAYGTYFIEESAIPAGYDADTESGTVDGVRTVDLGPSDAGQTVAVQFYNPPQVSTPPGLTSTIQVTKTDVDLPQNSNKIDGATFELYLDDNGDGVADANEEILTSPIDHFALGSYRWLNLPDGNYLVKEATPPPGYLLASGSNTKAVATIDQSNAGGTFTVEFQNQKEPVIIIVGGDPVRTAIEVTKRDATTSQPVDTATFQLWEDKNGNGTLEATDLKLSQPKDTANGVVSWVGLLKGTYFVEETVAPKGYDLPASRVLTIVVDGIAGGTLSRSFYDPQKRTTIELVKRDDSTRQVLAGAVFQAYLDVNEDGLLDAGDTKVGGTTTSDANGVVSWSGLKFGHYVIHEVTPPDNYDLASDQPVVLDRNNAGGTVALDFLDPAKGAVTITKVAFEKNADGDWVPSDGEVEFGDLVKYELTADAYGAKMYRDVWVVDYIPGFDPEDTKSTTKASYVHGSATCGKPATCPVTFDAGEQELAWSLGDMQGVERTLEFVVRMPLLPVAPVYDEDGLLLETVVNIAELSWQADATESTQRLAAEYGNRSIQSNEVVTTMVDHPKVLNTPDAERPETVKRPGALLPDTGAPTYGALFGTIGSLSLLLGAWLMLVSRGRGYLPQR